VHVARVSWNYVYVQVWDGLARCRADIDTYVVPVRPSTLFDLLARCRYRGKQLSLLVF
jgi:hypothetical protein